MMWSVVVAEDHLPILAHIMKPVFVDCDGADRFVYENSDLKDRGIYETQASSEI